MFIKNLNLRKSLGMGRLMQADGGAGAGGAADPEGNPDGGATDPTEPEGGADPKTFTQEELDKIVKERVARTKKDQPSKEELDAFKNWQDSQKTEEEKKNEALTNAEKARLAAEEKATALEAKVTCLSKGIVATSVDDVVILAKAMVTDDVTMEQAIDKVLEKYPSFKSEGTDKGNGFTKIGAGKGESAKKATDDQLKAAFGL